MTVPYSPILLHFYGKSFTVMVYKPNWLDASLSQDAQIFTKRDIVWHKVTFVEKLSEELVRLVAH